MPKGTSKRIDLERHKTTVPHKGQRSVDILQISAFLNSNNESLLISNEGGNVDIDIAIIDIFGGKCVYSEKYTAIKDVELSLPGLLNEGDLYRLEITIGDTVFYGDFSL